MDENISILWENKTFFSLFSLSQELFACEQKPHAFTDSLFIMQFIVVCSAAFHPPKHDTVIKNANNRLVIATKKTLIFEAAASCQQVDNVCSQSVWMFF